MVRCQWHSRDMCSSHARLAEDPLIAKHFNLTTDSAGRIIVPVSTLTGESGVVLRATGADVRPKEIWSPSAPRDQVLYNADNISELETEPTPLYLVETFAATWAMWRAGYGRVCALSGCLLAISKAARLKKLATSGTVVLLPAWDYCVRSVVRQNHRALKAAGVESVMVAAPAYLNDRDVADVADLYLSGGDVASYLASAIPATQLAIDSLTDKGLIER